MQLHCLKADPVLQGVGLKSFILPAISKMLLCKVRKAWEVVMALQDIPGSTFANLSYQD